MRSSGRVLPAVQAVLCLQPARPPPLPRQQGHAQQREHQVRLRYAYLNKPGPPAQVGAISKAQK